MIKKRVGILGATGVVGQKYISLLENHPWFEIKFLAASAKSAGKSYQDSVAGRWKVATAIPAHIKKLPVVAVEDISSAIQECDFVFSALDTDIAREMEPLYAKAGLPVFSNASAYRKEADVPVLIPEINSAHLKIIPAQQKKRGFSKGFIVVKPNCSIQSFIIPLAPIHAKFGLKQLYVTTMQALSGAGYPGVSSMDSLDNVIPFISGEEEKTELEPLKILGEVKGDIISPTSQFQISAHCNRVPTIDGHMACVSVSFQKKPSMDEILELWKDYKSVPQELGLPSAPKHPVIVSTEPDRPQTRLDRDAENGMSVTVGRLRPCHMLDYRFVGLSHNTVRGAAGGGILNAELAMKLGYF